MRFIAFKKRIGCVGMYRSGKTVFMTSLINHLARHDPDRFSLGNGRVRLGNFHALDIEPGWEKFQYERHRHSLVSLQRWPQKTKQARQYRFSLTRSDWRYTGLDLTLTDLPGERLADIRIAHNDYEGWSEEIMGLFTSQPEYRNHVTCYLDFLEKAQQSNLEPDEQGLIKAYKLALANCCLAFLPVITPSSFLLGPKGDYCQERKPLKMAETRYVGLDTNAQFTPLPRKLRAKYPKLALRFSNRFTLYKARMVEPTAKWLANCNELVVLLDITTILAGGLGMYHGALQLVEDLIAYLDPGRGLLGQVASTLTKPLTGKHLTLPGITRIAFVASKADKVHASDRQRLLALLRSMVEHRMKDLQQEHKLRVKYFACAGVKSTVSLDNGKIEAQPLALLKNANNGDCPVAQFTPSKVPLKWPENWQAHEYRFPDILPQIPARRDLAPPHIGLNLVADFLLAEDHWTE